MKRLICLTFILLVHPVFCQADDIAKLQTQVTEAEKNVSEYAINFRAAKVSGNASLQDLEASTKRLHQAVRALFDLQMKLQLAQLDDAETKIAASRQLLAERRNRAEKIVNKRLQSIMVVPAGAESPQAVLDAMERFTAAKDYAGLVGLMTDDETDRMAGMMLQSMSMMSSFLSLVEATQAPDEDADEVKLVIAKGQDFMRPNPSPEATAALQQVVRFLPSVFYELGATSNGKPLERPNLTAKQYADLLKQASGVLTDTRAYLVAMMTVASSMEKGRDIIPSQWSININGLHAVATQLAQPHDRTANGVGTVELAVEDGRWKISKLGSDEEFMAAIAEVITTSPDATPLHNAAPAYGTAPPLSSGVPYYSGDSPASSIRKRMQGRWIVESLSEATQDGLSEVQGTLEIHIRGNVLQFMAGTETSSGPVLLDNIQDSRAVPANANEPLPIDFVYDPNGQAETHQGIIACDGETLSICMAIETAKAGLDFRPRLFVPGSKVTLWKCRRASDKHSSLDSQ